MVQGAVRPAIRQLLLYEAPCSRIQLLKQCPDPNRLLSSTHKDTVSHNLAQGRMQYTRDTVCTALLRRT